MLPNFKINSLTDDLEQFKKIKLKAWERRTCNKLKWGNMIWLIDWLNNFLRDLNLPWSPFLLIFQTGFSFSVILFLKYFLGLILQFLKGKKTKLSWRKRLIVELESSPISYTSRYTKCLINCFIYVRQSCQIQASAKEQKVFPYKHDDK